MSEKTVPITSAYSELIDFIALGGGPEAVIEFRPSEATQRRAYELIDRERNASLSSAEAAELTHYVELEHILRMAKIRARTILQENV